jgi:hypothetical protein
MTVAQGSHTPSAFPTWLGLASAAISLRRVSRRIDARSSALGSSSEGDGRDVEVDRSPMATWRTRPGRGQSLALPPIALGADMPNRGRDSLMTYRFVVTGANAMQRR